MSDPLNLFSAPVRAWFEQTFGEPTPPQAAGWPAIQRGDHTLILAPTGSGKTLAAFLWGIDRIWQQATADGGQPTTDNRRRSDRESDHGGRRSAVSSQLSGVHLLYISPLKALNNDIERNLRAPLAGIRETAAEMGLNLPTLRVAVRTGDTPGSARMAMVKQPPHILITTPESLYLLLTSPRAREMLRTVRTVIVDEIHTLVGEKRGVHLALSLERLEHLAGQRIQRIGLSATVKPLEEAARFLGGQQAVVAGSRSKVEGARPNDLQHSTFQPATFQPSTPSASGPRAVTIVEGSGLKVEGVEPGDLEPSTFQPSTSSSSIPRAVTIVDTGYRKPLDLQVVTPVDDFRSLPGKSVWPTVIPHVVGDIMGHRSTLIFCNNRRLAERTADRLNAQITAERSEEVEPGSTAVLAPGGIMRDRGMFAIGAEGPIKAHHGSMSKEARRQMEEDLKAGKLPALVGTSSLELGIDIGAIDLVVQLQSPKSVSQGLQRVGRSGHMVGQTSRGRIYATFREDLVEAAAVARGMLEGDVEPTATPRNPLDVLAQQIVAMVSVETWSSSALYDLARQAYPYQDLPRQAFDEVLAMLSGAYQGRGGPGHASLRGRIAWDRVNDRLAALPGTRMLATGNPGVIPDTGAYDVYLPDSKTKIGTLDEEFIFETRVGDVFLLGSNTWRVQEINNDRVVVGEAAGVAPRMPFWRGDYPWRPFELGARIGRLRREIAERLTSDEKQVTTDEPDDSSLVTRHSSLLTWLRTEYALDDRSARHLLDYVRGQVEAIGAFSSDRTIVVESFVDAVGDPRMVVHSPFGGRVNGAWALALSDALRERFGMGVETQVDDDGILVRLPQASAAAPAEVVRGMTFADAKERILRELPNSALFGAHFRMNAARALLLPRAHGQKRTPFWLQRLKAKDLLATVMQYDDFPLVAETYRDCLRDVLDMPHLQEVLDGIQAGRIEVVVAKTIVPSPVAAGLLFNFVNVYMYEWDAPKAERQLQELAVRSEALDDLMGGVAAGALPRPEVVAHAVARAEHSGPAHAARTPDELAVFLVELGDLTTDEVLARCAGDPPPDPLPGREREGILGRTWLAQLAAQGRIIELTIPTAHGPERRWVPVEIVQEYHEAFDADDGRWTTDGGGTQSSIVHGPSSIVILRRFLRHAGPVTRAQILDRYAFPEDWLDDSLAGLVAEREIVQGYFTRSASPPGDESSPPGEEAHRGVAGPRDSAGALEFCDRHLFEQIQRATLAALRREVQPVPLPAFAEFLLGWQGLRTAPTSASVTSSFLRKQESSSDAPLQAILEQLRGAAIPGIAWERDILPARVPGFDPDDLAALCESGEWVWSAAGQDPRRADVRFFRRGEGALFLDPPPDGELGEVAQRVLAFLKDEGASFLTDLQGGLGLRPAELQSALVALTLAGLVTNDTLDALHAVLGHRADAEARRPAASALEEELAARLGPRPLSGTAARSRYHSAKRRVSARLRAQEQDEDIGFWRGRWALVHRPGILGPARSPAELAAARARVLLARYGIVTRETVAHEPGPWSWDALYEQFGRMELRGEVRRGYFVAGLPGVQFALPQAVEALREARNRIEGDALAGDAPVVLNAVDPACVQAALSGESQPAFARLPSTHVVIWQGRPILIAEDGGARLNTTEDAGDTLMRALQAYLTRPNAPRRQTVNLWNNTSVLDSPGYPLLQGLGFARTPGGLERWT
jgi:ATP-dependent Lhr-like helicase